VSFWLRPRTGCLPGGNTGVSETVTVPVSADTVGQAVAKAAFHAAGKRRATASLVARLKAMSPSSPSSALISGLPPDLTVAGPGR
jgi:hypothetical protein